MILGLILAGGQARRMGGGDKGRISLGGRELFAHVLERLHSQVDAIALNANGDVERFSDLGLSVLTDPFPDYPGPLAGILAGLLHAREIGMDYVLTVAADSPFFPMDLRHNLQKAVQEMREPEASLALASSFGAGGQILMQPTFGLWSPIFADSLAEALRKGTRKITNFTDNVHATSAKWEITDFDPFFNINTKEDLLLAEAQLSKKGRALG